MIPSKADSVDKETTNSASQEGKVVDKSSQASNASDGQQTGPQSPGMDSLCRASATEGRKPYPAAGEPDAAKAFSGSETTNADIAPTDEDEGRSTAIGPGYVGDEPPDDPNYVLGKIIHEGVGDSISDEADCQKPCIAQLTAYENSFERAAIMARRILGHLSDAQREYADVVEAVSRSLRLANDLRKTIGTLGLTTRAIHEHRNKGAKHRVVNYIIAQGTIGTAREEHWPGAAAGNDIQSQYFERIIHEINDAQAGMNTLETALYALPEGPQDAWLENSRCTQRYLIEAQVACNKAFDYHRAGGAKTTEIEHEKIAANCNADDRPPLPTDSAVKIAG
jgi:hypothetical protein